MNSCAGARIHELKSGSLRHFQFAQAAEKKSDHRLFGEGRQIAHLVHMNRRAVTQRFHRGGETQVDGPQFRGRIFYFHRLSDRDCAVELQIQTVLNAQITPGQRRVEHAAFEASLFHVELHPS